MLRAMADGSTLDTRNDLEPAVAEILSLADVDRYAKSTNGQSELLNKMDFLIGSWDSDFGYFARVAPRQYRLTPKGMDAAKHLGLGSAAPGASPEPALAALAKEFKRTRPYPSEHDRSQREARVDLATGLSRETLEAITEDPEYFDQLNLGKLAGSAYGGPGPQSWVHRTVNEGGDAKVRLANSLLHLLYDDSVDPAQRIDDLLWGKQWKVKGFGESLAVKGAGRHLSGDMAPVVRLQRRDGEAPFAVA